MACVHFRGIIATTFRTEFNISATNWASECVYVEVEGNLVAL